MAEWRSGALRLTLTSDYISAFSVAQHIAHQAPTTGCENDVVVIQFTAQFADKLKWRVEVLMKGQYFCIIKSLTSIKLPYIGLLLNPCLDLLRTNQWGGSFFCHCLQKRNYHARH